MSPRRSSFPQVRRTSAADDFQLTSALHAAGRLPQSLVFGAPATSASPQAAHVGVTRRTEDLGHDEDLSQCSHASPDGALHVAEFQMKTLLWGWHAAAGFGLLSRS